MSFPEPYDIDFAPLANKDLSDIFIFGLSEWGEEQAIDYDRDLRGQISRLASFPALGRVRDDVFPGCRGLIVRQHTIFYRIDGRTVKVSRIVHTKRAATFAVDEP